MKYKYKQRRHQKVKPVVAVAAPPKFMPVCHFQFNKYVSNDNLKIDFREILGELGDDEYKSAVNISDVDVTIHPHLCNFHEKHVKNNFPEGAVIKIVRSGAIPKNYKIIVPVNAGDRSTQLNNGRTLRPHSKMIFTEKTHSGYDLYFTETRDILYFFTD